MTEQFAKSSTMIKYHVMHPGWADTAAVRSSMPEFYEKMKDRLRTVEQGADTIVWLALQVPVTYKLQVLFTHKLQVLFTHKSQVLFTHKSQVLFTHKLLYSSIHTGESITYELYFVHIQLNVLLVLYIIYMLVTIMQKLYTLSCFNT